MAVLKIKIVSIIGHMNELGYVTEICGKSGLFHPDNPLSFYSDTSHFMPLNEENPFSAPLQRFQTAAESCGIKPRLFAEEAKTLSYEPMKAVPYMESVCGKLESIQKGYQLSQKHLEDYSREIVEFGHFVGLNLNLDEIAACRDIKVRFGSIPKDSFEKLNSYNENPYVIFFPSTHDEFRYWGVYFTPIDQAGNVDRIFSRLGFERTRLTELRGTPESAVEEMKQQLQAEQEHFKWMHQQAASYWEKEQDECCRVFTWLTEESACFGIRRYAARYNESFILTGWVPAYYEKELSKQLDSLQTVDCSFDDAQQELSHSPPVKLKNKAFLRPFEFFVDMYGLPSYDEIDPTPLVAFTYTVLFGLMFGDLGQGICVSLAGWFMWKWKGMALGKILIPCGISSALFGLFFGSVFGFEHALDPMYRSLFGLPEKPIEVMDPSKTNLIIGAAVVLGVLLVLTAILINIYSSLRRKHYENALFGPNGVAGLVFYASLIFGAVAQFFFGYPVFSPLYILCLIVVPLLLMYFKEVLGGLAEGREDWKPESWVDYCMQNFFELFEYILSYASNTISFLRVSAFVLVHAGMMSVVFTLAGEPGIGYVIVVVLGNILVMGLEGLLVGIQVLRLEFYEMFSRFFDGEGRPFRPVTIQ